MPLVPLQTISVHDFLALGKDKINENFASIASFVDFLEGEAHQERNSTIDVVQGLHGFSVGDAVRFDAGAGRFVRSTADTPENAEVMGVVSHYTDASHFKITLTGLLHDLGFTFEPGTVYYLQDDGSLGDTPGTVSRAVLGALPPETSGAPVRGVIINESSISSMSALRDVDLTGLTDNNTLVYSGGVWKAQNLDFDSIIGVDGNPVEGDVLIFTGGVWKPTQPTSGGDMYSAVYDPQRSGTVNQARVAETVEWGNILSKPTTFPPSSHIHTVADITGLSQQLGNKANATHVHPNATTSVSGFLSAQDKTKLDSFTANGSGYARLSEPNTFSSIQTMLSQTLLQNGAPTAPALSFTSETDMGIYRAGTGSLALSVGGTSRIRVTSTLATMDVNLNVTGNYARANTPTTGALDNRDLINRGWFNNNYLQPGDVTAGTLSILDTSNMVLNSGFDQDGYSLEGWSSPIEVGGTSSQPQIGNFARIAIATSNRNVYNGAGWFNIEPGETFYVSFWAYRSSANGNFRAGLAFRQPDGSSTTWVPAATALSSVANTNWLKYEGYVTAPGGNRTQARVWVSAVGNSTPAGYWNFANVIVRRATDSKLLVDGEIQITNADKTSGALSVRNSSSDEVLRVGNISGKAGVPSGTQFGLWGALGSGVYIPGSAQVIGLATTTATASSQSFTADYRYNVQLLSPNNITLPSSVTLVAGQSLYVLPIMIDFRITGLPTYQLDSFNPTTRIDVRNSSGTWLNSSMSVSTAGTYTHWRVATEVPFIPRLNITGTQTATVTAIVLKSM